MVVAGIVGLTAVLMAGVEWRNPGRRWPEVSGWWGRAFLLNGLQVAFVWLGGRLWNPWLREHRPWSADALGPVLGAFLGYLAVTFIYYWWHRWRHESPLLWRWFHQVHHSPQRIEIITSFYKHPLELAANGVLSSAILYGIVGLVETAAAAAVLITGLAELFYHWNVRTPYWLGFLIQRPESHCLHHQEGVHSFNYADLPLWDMLFGTFRNPEAWDARCGFGPGNEARLGEMLAGVDLHRGAIRRPRRTLRIAWGLLLLGLLQMFGDLAGLPPLKALAGATAASPAPKVFCAHQGYETISTRIRIEAEKDGRKRVFKFPDTGTPRLKGPYNRRNAYGAALVYGPILPPSTVESAWRYALCGKAPLLTELGLEEIKGWKKRIVYTPISGPRVILEVPCR